jgi:TonB family protein
MLLSTAVHFAVFLMWRGGVPLVELGPIAQRAYAVAPGGGSMHALELPLAPPVEIPPPPTPRLVIDAPVVEYDQPPIVLQGLALEPIANAGMPGLGTGLLGPGEADGSGSGSGGDYTSPIPRSIVPHWDPPDAVRGLEVTVRVFVDEWGRPTGEVELDPPTPHRGFNREIVERVRRMEYRPARRNGRPVAGWAEITFVF